MPIIRVIQGPNKGRVYPLDEERVILGRDCEEGIQILDQSASRQHAEVYRIGEMYFIRDLGSRNGTYMNEELKNQELLREGDRIRIGNTVLVFEDRKIMQDGEPFEFVEDNMDATMEFNLASSHTQRRGEKSRDHSGDLSLLFEVAKTVSSERHAKRLMEKMVEMIMRMTIAEAAYVFVREDVSGRFIPIAFRQEKDLTPGKAPKISRTIIRRVLQDHRAIMTSNAAEDARFREHDSIMINQIQSVICAPLVARDTIKGVIYLTSSDVTKQFSSEDLEFLTIVAMQAGIAFENIRAQEKQRQIFLNTVQVLVDIVENNVPEKKGHSQRVAGYVAGICDKLGIIEDEANNAKLSALLYDVGSTVKDSTENLSAIIKDDEEKKICTEQLRRTETFLKSLGISGDVLEIIQARFERYDGSGFPAGLKKDAVPRVSYVLKVCVAFDEALANTDREPDDALKIIRAEAGTAYDPTVVDALEISHRDGSLYNRDELFDSKLNF